jgi:hypothetical protein
MENQVKCDIRDISSKRYQQSAHNSTATRPTAHNLVTKIDHTSTHKTTPSAPTRNRKYLRILIKHLYPYYISTIYYTQLVVKITELPTQTDKRTERLHHKTETHLTSDIAHTHTATWKTEIN